VREARARLNGSRGIYASVSRKIEMAGANPGPNDFDAIPMQKTSPAVYIGAGIGGVVVLVLILFMVLSGKSDKKEVEALKNQVASADAATKTPEQLKAEREHLAMTQRALEAAESKKKEAEAEAAKKAAAAAPEGDAAPSEGNAAAPKKGGGGKPAPGLGDLDQLGAKAVEGL
jgi:hypothetical protein